MELGKMTLRESTQSSEEPASIPSFHSSLFHLNREPQSCKSRLNLLVRFMHRLPRVSTESALSWFLFLPVYVINIKTNGELGVSGYHTFW